MDNNSISVLFADSSHAHYAQRICDLIYESALQRGTGIFFVRRVNNSAG